MSIGWLIALNDAVVQWRRRSAFACDFGSDALVNLRRQPWINENRGFRLPQHVDESGSNHHSVSVDGALPCCLTQISNRCDSAIADSDVPRIPRRASAVDDVTVCDDKVKRWFRLRKPHATHQENDKSNRSGYNIHASVHSVSSPKDSTQK